MVAYHWKVVALRQISMLFFRKTVTLGAVCSPEGYIDVLVEKSYQKRRSLVNYDRNQSHNPV